MKKRLFRSDTIYQFRGANIGFIHQFENDYQAYQHYLVENYRSSAHIIAAANQLIQQNRDRMKQQHPIRINLGRKSLAAGGRWEKLDPLVHGRVQILTSRDDMQQAQVLVDELLRMRQLDSSLEWRQCAVLTTEWRLLNPVRACLEAETIPLSLALPKDAQPPPFRVRENLALLKAIKDSDRKVCKAGDWLGFLQNAETGEPNTWTNQLKQLLLQWQAETGDEDTGKQQLLEYLYESLAEQRRECRLGQGVFLSTVHSVKGMEFSHVFVLDGGWTTPATEEQRRLLYVAMTRAKETLCLMQRLDLRNPYPASLIGDFNVQREGVPDDAEAMPSINKEYAFLGLKDFDLSYAASFPEHHPIHQKLGHLSAGSVVTIQQLNGKLVVQKDAMTIAVFSKNAGKKWQERYKNIHSATVIAMIARYKADSEEEYQSRCKVEQWEVPMLEVVLS